MAQQHDILVIDDEQIVLDALIKIFGAEGFSVDTVVDANEALKKLEKNEYRIIISDIMMPEINGFQFLEEINNRQITSPVIMTTGYSTVENAVRSLYNGAIDFIAKPFTDDEIVNSVYRGLKYAKIQNLIEKTRNTQADSSIIYVPCPSKYLRLGYSSWAFEESIGSILVGVTDLFMKTIDGLESLEIQSNDDEVTQGNPCAQFVDKLGKVHQILSPVTGKIIERNEEVLTNINLIEKDPYFKGWIYRIIPMDSEFELKHLVPCSSDRL